MTMSDSEPAKPKRRRFRFSLRTLLTLVVLLSLPLAWVGIVAERTRQQKKILEQLEEYQPSVGWRFGYVVRLGLGGPLVTDAGLEHLEGLTELEWVGLVNTTQVTQHGLEHLKGLTKLKELYLDGTHVTDAGLVNLKGLGRLEHLDLCYTHVTEEGIEKLRIALPNCFIPFQPNKKPQDQP